MTYLVRGALACAALAGLLAALGVVQDYRWQKNISFETPDRSEAWLRGRPLSLGPMNALLNKEVEKATSTILTEQERAELTEQQLADVQREQIETQQRVFNGALPIAEKLLRRNGRHSLSRLVKAQLKLLDGDAEAFVADYVHIIGLERDNQTQLASSLAEQSRNLKVFEAMKPYLSEAPSWGRTYLETIRRNNILPPYRLVDYYAYYPDRQRALFEALLNRGYLDQAYLAFFKYLGDDATEFLSIPYDPEFLGFPGAAPFNWVYPDQVASRRPNGGVEVAYNRERNVLLWQIFPLSPGTYEVSADMTGSASQTRGYFAWQMQCLPGGQVIVQANVEELSTTSRTISFDTTIPRANCPYQTIRLIGVSGSFPRAVYAEISRIDIERKATRQAVEEAQR